MKITEQNFVQELSRGNEQALEYVMVHYGGLVRSVAHRYLSVLSQYEEECISDVFFAVWNHIDSFQPDRNPFANWIAGIARLKALDYKRKYASHLLESSWDEKEDFLEIEEALDMQTQFSEEFSRETTEMLSCLKPRDRELFLKLYVEEKSFDEIARETGTEKPVLYNRLSRSKRKLRTLFPRGSQALQAAETKTVFPPFPGQSTVKRK